MDDRSDDPVRRHPTVARLRAMLGTLDPEVLAAVDDVDRTLIIATPALAHAERVRSSVETALFPEHWSRGRRSLSRIRRPMTPPRRRSSRVGPRERLPRDRKHHGAQTKYYTLV